MRRILVLGLCSILAGSTATLADPARPIAHDFSHHFGDYQGCFVSQRLGSDEFLVHGLPLCQEPLAPCSTFKLPNTLIGLETAVIPDAEFVLPWDGTQHARPVLNRDHNLRSAVRESVVWYFQELARRVGKERMQELLSRLDYGNMDISGGLTEFWLSSSLELSALDQVAFLERLHRGTLPVSKRSMAVLRDILVLKDAPGHVLRGKTGSCLDDTGECCSHGWFVGSVTRGEEVHLFATFVKGAWSGEARPIARAILAELGILIESPKSERP